MIKLIAIVGTFFLVQLFAHMTVVYCRENMARTEQYDDQNFRYSFLIALAITYFAFS